MLFNSLEFVAFFAVVYFAYRLLRPRAQNLLLLAASYYFYSRWNWRFTGLLLLSTSVAFAAALGIARTGPRTRKLLAILSIGVDLTILGIFKYFNFFADNIVRLAHGVGIAIDPIVLQVALPIGISFYTFHTISYIVDVYKRRVEPTRSFVDFALFVSYFPQLVAGPIARAHDLLPQVARPRVVSREQVEQGVYLVFWGLFQKIFVADNLALIVDQAFSQTSYDGLRVLLGVYAFALQIYGDFAGYSNMAIGLGKLMGFELALNFDTPYFSADPWEFWRRWHISLSSWLRDYLYTPLGGGVVAALVTMLLGGLWHGAKWTFVVWGAYHGLLIVLFRLARPLGLERVPRALRVFVFFQLVCLGWLLFRADSLTQAGQMLASMKSGLHFSEQSLLAVKALLVFGGPLLAIEALQQRTRETALFVFGWPVPARVALYVSLFYGIVIYGVTGAQNFIYFAF